MNEKERLNALDVALNNEMQERAFYLKHAGRTTNPVGKAMFKRIADEEMEHYERLKQLHEKWSKKEIWPETVPLKVKDTVVKNILKDLVKSVDRVPKRDEDDLKAIRTAIDFEAKGEAHYAKLRDDVADSQEKAFFDLLSRIEHEHYLSLKETEEYLTDPASWFSRAEHQILDGA
jgi:rubrerythrin